MTAYSNTDDHTREVLCDETREAIQGPLGYIDNPDSMSTGLQEEIWSKVFVIQIEVLHRPPNLREEQVKYRFGQAGMLRSRKIPFSGAHDESRYEVVPVTAKHNMEALLDVSVPISNGVRLKCIRTGVMKPVHFNDNGVRAPPPEQQLRVSLPGTDDALSLPLGIDVAYGRKIEDEHNSFTSRYVSFDVAQDHVLQVGQKIGIVVWRRGRIYPSDDGTYSDPYDNVDIDGETIQGPPEPRLSEPDETKFFGPTQKATILTGIITAIYEGGTVFRHNINTYPGCSGAIIFLLDKGQPESVQSLNHGRAIGVHAGGKTMARFNMGMAIHRGFAEMFRPEENNAVLQETAAAPAHETEQFPWN